ncbi:MAG: GTP cyclohydrolase I FolE2 [Acidobacteria bacterium]|nr:GTP cyclohydrolase I FolE2 [Acidobacteriota bacterium]MBE3130453.1 GTP cyclohydrolase I FolE2 [Acidobacteriota bacterium]
MADEKRFLVDVGMDGLPFPIKAASKVEPEGQNTIATISVKARIMHEFEAEWIDRFIQIVHRHRDRIGTATLRVNTLDYLKELNATAVRVDFEYPFFVEKRTPVSGEKCLVRYTCGYSVKVPSLDNKPKVFFRIKVPCITTFPKSGEGLPGGLFGQLSVVSLEVESAKDFFPEDAVALVDRHALAPVYSFLTLDDQTAIIRKIHEEKKTSVVMVDEIKGELMANKNLDFYSVHCANFGMLHSYATVVGTEKSMWVPFSGYEDSEV